MTDVLFGQRQAPWASDRLGTSSDTIYHYGCFLCSMAMSATRMGKDADPRRLNQAFIRAGVYVQQELLPDAALARIYGDVRLTYSRTFGGPADLSQLQRAPGEEAWVMVDFDHNPADGIETHWIRVQAWDGRTLVVDDPWYGDRGDFVRHYGANLAQTIQKIVRVSGPSAAPAPPPPAPAPPPEEVDLEPVLFAATCNGKLPDGSAYKGTAIFVSNIVSFRWVRNEGEYKDLVETTIPEATGKPAKVHGGGQPAGDLGAFGSPIDKATADILGLAYP